MVWEGPQGHIDEAEPFWKKYLDDLDHAPAVRPEERPQARGLVWLHLAEEFADYAAEFALDDPGAKRVDPEVKELRRRAAECFEESLKAFPGHGPSAYRAVSATLTRPGASPTRRPTSTGGGSGSTPTTSTPCRAWPTSTSAATSRPRPSTYAGASA